MASFNYKTSSGVVTAKKLIYQDGSNQRTLKEVWYHDGTAARKVFSAFTATAAYISCDTSASAVNPQVRFQTDGSTLKRNTANALVAASAWGAPITSGAGAGMWIRVTLGTGSSSVSGDSVGVWLQMNVERLWSINAPTVGNQASRTLNYQISTDSAGVTVVASNTIDLLNDRT